MVNIPHWRESVKEARSIKLVNLKAIREERGISAAELAEKTGLTRGAISKIENGIMGATVRNLCAFADILHCSTDALLGRGDSDILPQIGGDRHAG